MKKAQQRTPRSIRPNLESLEDRNQPATWTQLSNLGGGGEMMLLTDGRVIAEAGGITNSYSILTPDNKGSYPAADQAPVA